MSERSQIGELTAGHLPDAAALAARRYAALRRTYPLMPARWEDPSLILPLLTAMTAGNPGAVALCGGRLVGFLTGWLIPSLRGQRAVYSPEWANGTDHADEEQVLKALYIHMADCWTAAGHPDHYVTVLAHDRAGMAGWQWCGFGYYVIDALRPLAPAAVGPIPADGPIPAGVEIRRAAAALRLGLRRHLSASPVFLPWDAAESDTAELTAWLAEPRHALWMAWRGGQAIAEIAIGPASENACTVIRDAGTASITSGYTLPGERGGGVATAVLDAALDWARGEGYARCCVDFEAMNVPGSAFWLRHFQPVCYSFYRHVNRAAQHPSC
jgi:GNAT superfamily N-acetyltransferase